MIRLKKRNHKEYTEKETKLNYPNRTLSEGQPNAGRKPGSLSVVGTSRGWRGRHGGGAGVATIPQLPQILTLILPVKPLQPGTRISQAYPPGRSPLAYWPLDTKAQRAKIRRFAGAQSRPPISNHVEGGGGYYRTLNK